MAGRALALLVAICGCAGQPAPERPQAQRPPRPLRSGPPAQLAQPAQPGGDAVAWERVEAAADLPGAPAPGTYQVHMIDVGTGLAILIRGADFAMLYDAGTSDPGEKPTRAVR